MRPKEIKAEISQLEFSEKILLIEDVWDSIAENNAVLHMSEWQKQELDNRYKEYKKGNVELHDSKSVYDSLRKKYE